MTTPNESQNNNTPSNQMGNATILFLYTRLSPYLMACLRALSLQVRAIHIVHYPAASEAPFTFTFPQNVVVHRRTDVGYRELKRLTAQLHPSLILCSGWRDFAYLRLCRKAVRHIPTLLLMDNHWQGLLRQRLWQQVGGRVLPRYFSRIWIPGPPQESYALRLGFAPRNILTGFYCADVALFSRIYQQKQERPDVPKVFLFVGRYVARKGLLLLTEAFMELKATFPNPWQLWCIGEGPLKEQLPAHPDIRHQGFIPQDGMAELLNGAGVFVLPAQFEPWGMVVQEMATAGMPVLTTAQVGAASQFVRDGKNGWMMAHADKEVLKEKMRQIMMMDSSQLKRLSAASHQLGISYTPSQWVRRILGVIEDNKE